MRSSRYRSPLLLPSILATAIAVAVAGCSSTATPVTPAVSDAASTYDGEAKEVTEAQLSLVFGGADGVLRQLDLATESETVLLEPAAGKVTSVSGDGRFISRLESIGAHTTVEIVDSGVWTVEHGDHFHYYQGAPRTIGSVAGEGRVAVRSADRRTAVTFATAGEVLLVSHDDLEAGIIGDPVRVSVSPHPDALVVPFGGALLATNPDENGTPATVEAIGEHGAAVGEGVACAKASDVTTTSVGVVFACETGAVLATETAGVITFEEIPYPIGVDAPPATSLEGRIGRPSVAGPAGDVGAWRLDARAREWTFLPSEIPLVAIAAVADDKNLAVAVDNEGRIRVLDASGGLLSATEPVLTGSVADLDSRTLVRVIVDAQRAYVSDPTQDRILEIDYRDKAQIARIFPAAGLLFLEQVG